MIYKSTRLGDFELQDSDVIHFPDGLYGFETQHWFALLPLSETTESPLQWLHSLNDPDLAFVVTDPYLYNPDYQLYLTDEEKNKVLLNSTENAIVLAIVTIPKDPAKMTANLVAPIVINPEKNIAKQFVLTTLNYHTKHHLFPQEESKV